MDFNEIGEPAGSPSLSNSKSNNMKNEKAQSHDSPCMYVFIAPGIISRERE